MNDLKKRHIPTYEFVTFFIIVILITIYFFTGDLNVWLFLTLIVLTYLIILGSSRIIILKEDALKVISISPLFDSHTIPLNSIQKIRSEQTYKLFPRKEHTLHEILSQQQAAHLFDAVKALTFQKRNIILNEKQVQ